MPKFYQSNKFKNLNKKWQGKLKDSGFNDLESTDFYLKEWHSLKFRNKTNDLLTRVKIDYYRLAGHFLHDHSFKNELQYKMWSLHSQGMGFNNIAITLGVKTGKVRYSIQKLVNLMRQIYPAEIEE